MIVLLVYKMILNITESFPSCLIILILANTLHGSTCPCPSSANNSSARGFEKKSNTRQPSISLYGITSEVQVWYFGVGATTSWSPSHPSSSAHYSLVATSCVDKTWLRCPLRPSPSPRSWPPLHSLSTVLRLLLSCRSSLATRTTVRIKCSGAY